MNIPSELIEELKLLAARRKKHRFFDIRPRLFNEIIDTIEELTAPKEKPIRVMKKKQPKPFDNDQGYTH